MLRYETVADVVETLQRKQSISLRDWEKIFDNRQHFCHNFVPISIKVALENSLRHYLISPESVLNCVLYSLKQKHFFRKAYCLNSCKNLKNVFLQIQIFQASLTLMKMKKELQGISALFIVSKQKESLFGANIFKMFAFINLRSIKWTQA